MERRFNGFLMISCDSFLSVLSLEDSGKNVWLFYFLITVKFFSLPVCKTQLWLPKQATKWGKHDKINGRLFVLDFTSSFWVNQKHLPFKLRKWQTKFMNMNEHRLICTELRQGSRCISTKLFCLSESFLFFCIWSHLQMTAIAMTWTKTLEKWQPNYADILRLCIADILLFMFSKIF